jgi:hypothetical protein
MDESLKEILIELIADNIFLQVWPNRPLGTVVGVRVAV